jgi:RND family efflux transporter MFP subunit
MLLMACAVSVSASGSEFDCLIEPKAVVKVGSPVPGLLKTVTVERGDWVKAGQVLGTLLSDVEEATENLAATRASSRAAVLSARAQVEYEERRRARNEDLYRQKAISAQDMEKVDTELALRRLELQAAEEEQRIAALELARVRALLAIRTIRSPVDGVVMERTLSPGEFVVDEGRIATIARVDPLNVEVFLPAALYGSVTVGNEVQVQTEPDLGGPRSARVVVVDRVMDAASGTFGVRLDLPNPHAELPAGLRCKVTFPDVMSAAAP